MALVDIKVLEDEICSGTFLIISAENWYIQNTIGHSTASFVIHTKYTNEKFSK